MFASRRCSAPLVFLAAALSLTITAAQARTATYVSPPRYDPAAIAAVSTSGDAAGLVVALNQTFALVFDQPFGVVKNTDNITIFTLEPERGDARATVSFGVFNNGAPIIVRTQNVNAGNRVSISNLFQQGCSVFGGCDYIAITTTRARNGATGVPVDYISVNGEVTDVQSPTPEPNIWALMIVGFVSVAWRLKAARGGSAPLARSAPRWTRFMKLREDRRLSPLRAQRFS